MGLSKNPSKYPLAFAELLLKWREKGYGDMEIPQDSLSKAIRLRFALYDYFRSLEQPGGEHSEEMLKAFKELYEISKKLSIRLDKKTFVLRFTEAGKWLVNEALEGFLKPFREEKENAILKRALKAQQEMLDAKKPPLTSEEALNEFLKKGE